MRHSNYFEFKAKGNYELGLMIGDKFKHILRNKIDNKVKGSGWGLKVDKSKEFLEITNYYFPQYINEIEGYAKGAGIDFTSLWVSSLEDEFDYYKDKCTFIATSKGMLLSHNEDWEKNAESAICILKKTTGNLTVLELYYYNTLGGNSISINSYGYTQSINTLTHKDWQLGVPRNVIARWLSETDNPQRDFERLKTIKRSLGYNHNIVNKQGQICNIECTSKRQVLTKPVSPFIHTNHYLSEKLKELEGEDKSANTYIRDREAVSKVKDEMTIDEIIKLNSDTSKGSNKSIFNERTIGRMVIDLNNMNAKIWLLREEEKGWEDYSLGFLN